MNLDVQFLAWPMVVLAAIGAGHWWHRRRVTELLTQMSRLDRARQNSEQMAQQARRQIEQLQKDLATQRQAVADATKERRRAATAATAAAGAASAAATTVAARAALERMLDGAAAPLRPANGFVDTQPMSR